MRSLFVLFFLVQIGDEVHVRIIEVDPINRKIRLTMREIGVDGPSGGMGGGGGGGRGGGGGVQRKPKSVEAFLNIPPEEWIGGTVRFVVVIRGCCSGGAYVQY